MLNKTLTIWIISSAFIFLETKACVEQNQEQFLSCFKQFDEMEKGSNFWEDICSATGLGVLDCLLQITTECPQLWDETSLGDLSTQRALVNSISPASDHYAVKCERNTSRPTSLTSQNAVTDQIYIAVNAPSVAARLTFSIASNSKECDRAYNCFTSVFQQSDSSPYIGLTEFYRWFCGSQDGVMYIMECFSLSEDLCPATLDYIRNFKIIQYSDGNALTFRQVSQKASIECADIGVLVTECQDTGPCVVTLDKTPEAISTCLNNNSSQCFTEPKIDFGQNILQCDYADFTSQCIEDGCGAKAAGFFIRLFEFLDCGIKANRGCPAVSITLEVGQEGYETMTTVNFPVTLPGNTANKKCPTDYEGALTRRCSSNSNWDPVTSSCFKDILKDIRETVDTMKKATTVDPVNFQSVLDDLNEVTNPERDRADKPPVEEVKDIINDITDILEKNEQTTTKELESFLSIVSNAVDKTNEEEWNRKVETGASSILRDVERNIDKTVSSQGCIPKVTEKDNLAVTIGASDADIIYLANDDAGEIFVSKQALQRKGLTGSVCYGGVHYETVAPILSRNLVINGEIKELDVDRVVNTDVISLQFEQNIDSIDPPALLTFALLQRNLTDPVCVSWDFLAPSTAGNGAWTREGCEFVKFSENGEIICQCSHLTNFAVLMSTAKTNADHIKALSIISAVGCAISIVGLLLTIIFHVLVWRLVRSDRSIILMNLCVALLIALLAFLAGINRTESPEACKAIAAILHFLFLAVFFLMLTQGIEIMICVVHVFVTKVRLKLLLPVAWLIPAIIVAISLGVTKTEGYGNKEFCWLSVESGLIWAFIGPAAIVIIINIIVIIVVFKKLFSSHAMKDKSAKERTKTSLRSICVLLPLLGCTWAFGILSVNSDTVVFQYIFCILNSLQGLFIFLFHCVFNNQIKDALRKRNARKRSLATFESDLKKRSRSDSMGQDVSTAVADKNSSESSSKKKSKLHRQGAKANTKSKDMNGLDEWQREQRRHYQREVRRQISDKLDWTENPDWTA